MNGKTLKKADPTDISNIIPPKLLKTYDVFIILKPKDNDYSNNMNAEETNLIDFDTDVACSQKENTPKLSDTESKKELSIIDLYEDITVSPHILRLQKKSIDKEIFDPLELKSLTDDDKATKFTDDDTRELLKGLDKSYLAPTTSTTRDYFYDKSNAKFKQNDSDDEDLIDDILSGINHRLVIYKDEKCAYNSKINDAKYLNVPKIIRTQNKNALLDTKDVDVAGEFNKEIKKNLSNTEFEIPKIIRTQNDVLLPPNNKTLKDVSDATKIDIDTQKLLKTEVSAFSDIQLIRGISKDFIVIEKKNENDELNLENIAKVILPNHSLQQSMSRTEICQYIDNLLDSKTVFCGVLKYYNPIDFYASNNNEYEFVVDKIQMDMKKYRKSRVCVEDSVAAKYTQGPSFEEKKLVLPQIMDRLVEKKKRMEKYAHCKRKLVLDCGARQQKIPVKLNPTVLTEDCNQDRLRNFKMRQTFDNFVRTGQR